MTISTDGQGAKVVWEEALFSDNSNEDVFIWSSHKPGQYFSIGETAVTYFATDNSGNNASCTFNITVKGEPVMKKNRQVFPNRLNGYD